MSNYDRFKPTPLKQMAERKEEVQKITNDSDDFQNGQKFKKLNIKEDGTYTIRVYPPHPDLVDANSMEPKVIYFVPGMRKKRNAQKQVVNNPDGTPIMERYNRPVFNSQVHGGAPFDLVDTYTTLATKKAETLYPDNKEQQKNYLAPLVGNKFSGGVFMGMKPMKSFLMYGDLLEGEVGKEKATFHEFEVHKAIENGMQKIAALENKQDPLGTDGCFTDPLDGRPVQIIVDSAAGKLNSANYYTVAITNEMEKINVNGRLANVMIQYPLTDEQLDFYEKDVPPLLEYRNKFTGRDLEIQLTGLMLFDEEHGYNVMDTEEFKNVYNALDKLFPKVEENNTTGNSSDDNNVSNNAAHQSSDEYDLMDMPELQQYIKDADLGITVLKRYTEADVREMIREVEAEKAKTSKENIVETSAAETTEQQEENQPEDEAANPPAATGTTANWRDRVKNLGDKVTA